jgi:3-methylcrotonyl-CoA carboxylase alpha subunit
LLRLVAAPDFAAGEVDTGFIERHRSALLPQGGASSAALAVASLAIVADDAASAARHAARSGDPHSPWQRRDGWRLAGAASRDIHFRDGEAERCVQVDFGPAGVHITIDDRQYQARVISSAAGDLSFTLDGASLAAAVTREGDAITIVLPDETRRLIVLDPLAPPQGKEAAAGKLTAPMPGKVLEVLVAAGATVKRGQLLMLLEAMKMEHAITAPVDGVVEAIHYAAGDLVEEGALLLAFKTASE